jgi:hypothetical protein
MSSLSKKVVRKSDVRFEMQIFEDLDLGIFDGEDYYKASSSPQHTHGDKQVVGNFSYVPLAAGRAISFLNNSFGDINVARN